MATRSTKPTRVVIGEPAVDPVLIGNLEAAVARRLRAQQRIDDHEAEVTRLTEGKSEIERQIIVDAAARVRQRKALDYGLDRAVSAEGSARMHLDRATADVRAASTEPARRLIEMIKPAIEAAVSDGYLGTLTLVPVEVVYEPTLPGYHGSFRVIGTDSPLPAPWWQAVMRDLFRHVGIGPYGKYSDEWSTPLDFPADFQMIVSGVSVVDRQELDRRNQRDEARFLYRDRMRQAGYEMAEIGGAFAVKVFYRHGLIHVEETEQDRAEDAAMRRQAERDRETEAELIRLGYIATPEDAPVGLAGGLDPRGLSNADAWESRRRWEEHKYLARRDNATADELYRKLKGWEGSPDTSNGIVSLSKD